MKRSPNRLTYMIPSKLIDSIRSKGKSDDVKRVNIDLIWDILLLFRKWVFAIWFLKSKSFQQTRIRTVNGCGTSSHIQVINNLFVLTVAFHFYSRMSWGITFSRNAIELKFTLYWIQILSTRFVTTTNQFPNQMNEESDHMTRFTI